MLNAQHNLERILSEVGSVARDVAAPAAERTDRDGEWPEVALRALQARGLGGLVVSTAEGGLGQGLEALVRASEILGGACASTAMCFGMHCVASAVIAAKATPSQRETLLRDIAAGRHLSTLALSEPGTGSTFYIPEVRLSEHGDGLLRVDGTKSFVTNAGRADSYVVSAVEAGGHLDVGRFSCVIVPAATPGLTLGPPWNGLGMRGNASRSLGLDGVVLSREQMLGEPGDEIWYVFNVIAPYFLMAMAGTYLGVATAALKTAIDHLRARVHSHRGQALAASPIVQHRVGTLWAQIERTRRLTYHAAREADAGGPEALPALCSAKAEVAETGTEVVNEVLSLVGGRGYEQGGALGRHLRDIRAAHVMAPTTDLLRLWVGRELLGMPLLAE